MRSLHKEFRRLCNLGWCMPSSISNFTYWRIWALLKYCHYSDIETGAESTFTSCSEKWHNPGKAFFSELETGSMRLAGGLWGYLGITVACRSPICSILALNLNGWWKANQRFAHFRTIVKKNDSKLDWNALVGREELDVIATESHIDWYE